MVWSVMDTGREKEEKTKGREGLQTSSVRAVDDISCIAAVFHEYALYSTLLNLLVIPLMSVLMTGQGSYVVRQDF